MKLSQRAKIAKAKIKQKIENNKEEIVAGACIIGGSVLSGILGYLIGDIQGFGKGFDKGREHQYDADRNLAYELAKTNGWQHVENNFTHDILCSAPCIFTQAEAMKKPTVITFKPDETFDVSKFMDSNSNLFNVDPVHDPAYVVHHVDVWATK